ncbi:MAG TPA: hypothetical protein VGR37_00480 [Longimicrobiaceae bacterium]|nr:hypothetical protein [Longimicrobiaceae bacterium]
MSRPSDPRNGEELRKIREQAERIAADARDLAESSRPAALTGERPELVPQAPPALDIRGSGAIHRAEQVRAADDVATSLRQEELAAGQADAAGTLQHTGRELDEARDDLEETERRAAEGARRAGAIRDDVERLSDDVSRLREQADEVPEVADGVRGDNQPRQPGR